MLSKPMQCKRKKPFLPIKHTNRNKEYTKYILKILVLFAMNLPWQITVGPFPIMSCNTLRCIHTICLIARCGPESMCRPRAAKGPMAEPLMTLADPISHLPGSVTWQRHWCCITYYGDKAFGGLANDNLKRGHSLSPHYKPKPKCLKWPFPLL